MAKQRSSKDQFSDFLDNLKSAVDDCSTNPTPSGDGKTNVPRKTSNTLQSDENSNVIATMVEKSSFLHRQKRVVDERVGNHLSTNSTTPTMSTSTRSSDTNAPTARNNDANFFDLTSGWQDFTDADDAYRRYRAVTLELLSECDDYPCHPGKANLLPCFLS